MKKCFKLIAAFAFLLTTEYFFVIAKSPNANDKTLKSIQTNFESPTKIQPEWEEFNSYSQICNFFIQEPKAFCHAIKIDLHNPSLEISDYPGVQNSSKKKKTKSIRPSKLSKNCDIVINTVPYTQKPFSSKKPLGILQSKKNRYSEPNQKYSALEIFLNNNFYSAKIYQIQTDISNDFAQENTVLIHGGFWQILDDGKIIQFKDIHDSRTACGISKDERFFYIFIVESGNKIVGEGLSYPECAEILKSLGAWNAIQFDGGHSSCLYLNGKNALLYKHNYSAPGFICFATKNLPTN